ncbi:MAG TPA: hypothetical protein VMB48_08570 [Steroidobacteraceae bacterium]|nr:hypothetical protein [Steroidobacteraceae bacterium]
MSERVLDHDELLRLANDPAQTEDARRRYRQQLQARVHDRLREAFRAATEGSAGQFRPRAPVHPVRSS